MARSKVTYDVFISHSADDRRVAKDLAKDLRRADVTSFLDADSVDRGVNIADTFWEAISESLALVAILSGDDVRQSLGFEIGAAAAWNKPVFIVLNAPSTTRLPRMLQQFPVFPISRLPDLVHQIKSLQVPLSDASIDYLKQAYVSVGVPTDQLSSSPKALQRLTTQVNQRVGRTHSGETLLRELLRLRKRGELPRLRKAK